MFSLILMLCGCSFEEEADEYANFKHYKTRDFIKIVGNGGYAVASLPPAGELGSETVIISN